MWAGDLSGERELAAHGAEKDLVCLKWCGMRFDVSAVLFIAGRIVRSQ
jgi:hypothetical protein